MRRIGEVALRIPPLLKDMQVRAQIELREICDQFPKKSDVIIHDESM